MQTDTADIGDKRLYYTCSLVACVFIHIFCATIVSLSDSGIGVAPGNIPYLLLLITASGLTIHNQFNQTQTKLRIIKTCFLLLFPAWIFSVIGLFTWGMSGCGWGILSWVWYGLPISIAQTVIGLSLTQAINTNGSLDIKWKPYGETDAFID